MTCLEIKALATTAHPHRQVYSIYASLRESENDSFTATRISGGETLTTSMTFAAADEPEIFRPGSLVNLVCVEWIHENPFDWRG
jgi:hypothetical protein